MKRRYHLISLTLLLLLSIIWFFLLVELWNALAPKNPVTTEEINKQDTIYFVLVCLLNLGLVLIVIVIVKIENNISISSIRKIFQNYRLKTLQILVCKECNTQGEKDTLFCVKCGNILTS